MKNIFYFEKQLFSFRSLNGRDLVKIDNFSVFSVEKKMTAYERAKKLNKSLREKEFSLNDETNEIHYNTLYILERTKNLKRNSFISMKDNHEMMIFLSHCFSQVIQSSFLYFKQAKIYSQNDVNMIYVYCQKFSKSPIQFFTENKKLYNDIDYHFFNKFILLNASKELVYA